MRAHDHVVAISLAALAALATVPAVASPTYPGIVQDTLGMRCVPSCTICHETTRGGPYTVKKKFGRALMSTPFELVSKDEDQLRAVLKAFENVDQMRTDAGLNPLTAQECAAYPEDGELAPFDDPNGRWVTNQHIWLNGDTDCDTVGDTAELGQNRDPNTNGKGNLCAFYGCGASRIAPHPTGNPTAFLAAVGVAGLVGAIWRRRRKPVR